MLMKEAGQSTSLEAFFKLLFTGGFCPQCLK